MELVTPPDLVSGAHGAFGDLHQRNVEFAVGEHLADEHRVAYPDRHVDVGMSPSEAARDPVHPAGRHACMAAEADGAAQFAALQVVDRPVMGFDYLLGVGQ